MNLASAIIDGAEFQVTLTPDELRLIGYGNYLLALHTETVPDDPAFTVGEYQLVRELAGDVENLQAMLEARRSTPDMIQHRAPATARRVSRRHAQPAT